MDIEQQLSLILTKQKQLEDSNKRMHKKIQSIIARNGKIQDKKIEQIEESIRRLGNRIGILEKQVERILTYQFPDKE
jgi:hypothetical protein